MFHSTSPADCGYIYGLGARDVCSRFTDALLDLPRITVPANASFDQFVRRLGETQPATIEL